MLQVKQGELSFSGKRSDEMDVTSSVAGLSVARSNALTSRRSNNKSVDMISARKNSGLSQASKD